MPSQGHVYWPVPASPRLLTEHMCEHVCTVLRRKLALCQRYKRGVFLASYPDIVAEAFGRPGQVLASVVLSCELASLAVGFMILVRHGVLSAVGASRGAVCCACHEPCV